MLFYEIFCEEAYRMVLSAPPAFVLDLGANVGLSTLYLHTEFPDARIVAVEPNPAVFVKLARATSSMPNITAIPAAVTSEDGPVNLHVDESVTVAASLVGHAQSSSVTVAGKTIATILREANIPHVDHVKFDIEGAEYATFAAFADRDAVRSIVGEVHEDLIHRSLAEFEALWSNMCFAAVPTRKQGRFIVYGTRA